MKARLLLVCCSLLFVSFAQAQAPDNTQDRLKALEERIRALEAELQALKAGPPAAAIPSATAPAPPPSAPSAAPQSLGGGGAAMAKILNPDISVIGNFLGAVGRNTVRPVSSLEMRETEVGFQAVIDPYARGDFFISFGEEGVALEEGYITFTALPGGLVARAGKMRSAFGKVNLLHAHNLPWTDRPLVTENLLGGEDGVTDAGFSFSRILPAPKGIFLEATGQVFRGDSGNVFAATRKRDASVVGHLRGYGDFSESTNLDLGFSYARGHNDLGSDFLTHLYGLDATLRWKPLRRSIYHSFIARTELVWSQRHQQPSTQRAFGFFTSAEYRLNRRWTLGGRFDRSEQARDASLTDTGFSALLTYWPSEFSQIRGQYRFARYAEPGPVDLFRNANELRFQFLFVLGAHGAHPF